jgi:5'-nucleotidase/UDP-sugar diphosphatase
MKRWLWLGFVLLVVLSACTDPAQPTATATVTSEPEPPKPTFTATTEPEPVNPTATSTSEPELTGTPGEADTLLGLTILYTNDEHGWMEATEETGGAAGLLGLWREQEGYFEDGPFLILSGGDMWTGPAISTWFDGESMVEVMNAMGYDAAAVGNHEFDLGLDGLAERTAQMEFPLLSANIRDKAMGDVADIAVPYIVKDVSGISVGLIGLSSLRTPQTTMPDNVAGFDFVPYKAALEEFVPQAIADGAELLIIVGHICGDEMRALAPTAAELGVSVIGGGHCHERVRTVVDGVALIESGAELEAYAKVDLVFDTATDTVVSVEPSTQSNAGGTADLEIAAIVDAWRAEADAALSYPIGYVQNEIAQRADTMLNMVTDAWLEAYPAADVALSNRGGFRQSIPAGEITPATVVGVLPFNNVLIDVELTGAQLIENIKCCQPAIGGMTTGGGYQLADGSPLDPEATYHVLVNDFMYAGGDDFELKEYDPGAYNTGIDWRQPVIDWITSLKTSPENPLDDYLDAASR